MPATIIPVERGDQAAFQDAVHVFGCEEFSRVGYVLEDGEHVIEFHQPRGGLTLPLDRKRHVCVFRECGTVTSARSDEHNK